MRRFPSRWWLSPLLALAGTGASAADLQGIRLIEDDAGTRIELAMVGAAQYKYFTLQNPERLVLDLQASRLADGFQLPAPTGIVANVRTGKPAAGTLRVVFELGRAAPAQRRIEKDGSQSRLVLDLGGRRPPIAVSEAPSVAYLSMFSPLKNRKFAMPGGTRDRISWSSLAGWVTTPSEFLTLTDKSPSPLTFCCASEIVLVTITFLSPLVKISSTLAKVVLGLVASRTAFSLIRRSFFSKSPVRNLLP